MLRKCTTKIRDLMAVYYRAVWSCPELNSPATQYNTLLIEVLERHAHSLENKLYTTKQLTPDVTFLAFALVSTMRDYPFTWLFTF